MTDSETNHGACEEELAASLLRIVSERTGRGCNILIAEAGDFYVQFRWHDSGDEVLCEAVSNTYLDAERRIDEAAIAALRRFGFEDPGHVVRPIAARAEETAAALLRGAPDVSPNFFRYFAVHGPAAAQRVAQAVFCIFHGVYRVPREQPVQIKLILGDGCKTTGYFTAGR